MHGTNTGQETPTLVMCDSNKFFLCRTIFSGGSANFIILCKISKIGVLAIDLEFTHTLSKHNRNVLLNGSQHTFAWRV